jgi:hypothetical protein
MFCGDLRERSNEKERNRCADADHPHGRTQIGLIADVEIDEEHAGDDEGDRRAIDHDLRRFGKTGDQYRSREKRKRFEAIEMRCVRTLRLAFTLREPISRVVVIECAIPLRDANGNEGKKTRNEDAPEGDGHV